MTMKKIITVIGVITMVTFISPPLTSAQITGGTGIVPDSQSIQDEAAGKELYNQLQSGAINCAGLSNDNFDLLGDYFMGKMMGGSHSTMDALMTQRIGGDANRLMHIAMGKRLSGCDTSAAFPLQGANFLPMMGMMGGWSDYQPNNYNSMMGNYFGNSMMGGYYGGFGWIFMVLWLVLIIAGIIALARWVSGHPRMNGHPHGKTALDVLKDRYAKGEIDRKEFEEKKRDLND